MPTEKTWRQYAKRADATLATITADRDYLKRQLDVMEATITAVKVAIKRLREGNWATETGGIPLGISQAIDDIEKVL